MEVSISDGWVPEFAKDEKNCFIVPVGDDSLDVATKDILEAENLINVLTKKVIPMYYKKPQDWMKIVKQSMKDVLPFFDSGRMATEYYDIMYNESEPKS